MLYFDLIALCLFICLSVYIQRYSPVDTWVPYLGVCLFILIFVIDLAQTPISYRYYSPSSLKYAQISSTKIVGVADNKQFEINLPETCTPYQHILTKDVFLYMKIGVNILGNELPQTLTTEAFNYPKNRYYVR